MSYTVTNITNGNLTTHDLELHKGQAVVLTSLSPWILNQNARGNVSITPSIANNLSLASLTDSTGGTASGSNTLGVVSSYGTANNDFATLVLTVNQLLNAVNSLNNRVFGTTS
jgi:hypothetical protein